MLVHAQQYRLSVRQVEVLVAEYARSLPRLRGQQLIDALQAVLHLL